MPLIERIAKFSVANRLMSHLLFWAVLALVFLNRYEIDEYGEPLKILIRHAYYMTFTIIASYFLAYLVIPTMLKSTSYYRVIGYFLVGSYVICVVSRVTVIYITEPFLRTPPFGRETVWVILTDFPKLVTHYFMLNFSAAWIFPFVKLIRDQYITQQRTLILEKQRSETELKALKAQLNPHFLFNTLNNIYSLSIINSPLTSKAIAGLSEILDHVLYRCNGNYVPISTEINLVRNYIELERLRYDERLEVYFTYETDREGLIAPLILLSLVENAFKHGAGETTGKPLIKINLKLVNDQLEFSVSNTFISSSQGAADSGIGLNNITRQLDLIYPEFYTFKTTIRDGIFVALLNIRLYERKWQEK